MATKKQPTKGKVRETIKVDPYNAEKVAAKSRAKKGAKAAMKQKVSGKGRKG